jgi:DNA-binding transcriptional LysR family regulator
MLTGRKDKETLTFQPYLSMNDYAGLAQAAVAGAGIADLPPLVRPDLLRDGKLVEIMPKWRLRKFQSFSSSPRQQIPRAAGTPFQRIRRTGGTEIVSEASHLEED